MREFWRTCPSFTIYRLPFTIYDVRFELKLAWKYFRARRKSLARFTALVAVAGISCGVASLIVAQAVSRGFSGEMREKILSSTAHITVFQTDSREIGNWRTIKKEVEKLENVLEISPTTYQSAVIVGEKATSYAVLRAIQSSKLKVQNSGNESSVIEISLGAELAEKTDLKINDEAEIVIPQNESAPKTARVRVREIFRTGIYDYDATWIYISPEDLARATERERFTPTILSVSVKNIYQSDETARKIRSLLPQDFKVIDWRQANEPLFAALSLERKVSLIIISLVIFIAVLNITTTLALLVNERRLDIAILRTCGARTGSLIFIFLLEGVILSLTGIFFGSILGLTACIIGNYFRIINLPSEIYSLSYVPLIPNSSDVFLTAAIAFLLSLAAIVYPAWRAAKIKPLENLRNQ